MKKNITKYICDCCKEESLDENFIKFKGQFPFRVLNQNEYGTNRFCGFKNKEIDLCERCCEKLITDTLIFKFHDPESYYCFDERKGSKLV